MNGKNINGLTDYKPNSNRSKENKLAEHKIE